MIRSQGILILLILGTWSHTQAGSDDWRTTLAPAAISASDMRAIGSAVCGNRGVEATENGLSCSSCPEFTGNAGAHSGLEIGHPLRGHFSGAKAEEEWIIDTEGCEAHFAGFGGALLLERATPKPLPGSPADALAANPSASAESSQLELVYYKPGFRLNDCLIFDAKDGRSLLVCNEADMAQGEVIGHVSAMEITKRDITRWRLLRWYDNSATDMAEFISVFPTEMRQVELEGGVQGLHITMTILETTREAYENAAVSPVKTVVLEYQRNGQRLFATPETQQLLGEINLLTGKMLE